MDSRRILINGLSAWGGGSSSTYLINLLRELNRDSRGFDFTVISPTGMIPPEVIGRFGHIEIDFPRRGRTIARVLYEQTVLPFRARHFDMLYCVSDVIPSWKPIPTVVALRNLNIYDRTFFDDFRTRTLFAMIRAGIGRAAGIVCPSRTAAEAIAPLLGLPLERFSIVHYGIAREAFDEQAPESPPTPYLFCPSSLERHKNLEVLLESLPLMDDLALEVWVVGGGSLEPEYGETLRRRAREEGLADRVRFLGAVPYREILDYYRNAAAMVFPSLLESFGHPMLEAMLTGTPIVASELPIFREIAGDAALYFPPHDPEALAAAVRSVLQEPEATRRRIEIGAQRVQEFSWKNSIDELCRVFERAIAAGR